MICKELGEASAYENYGEAIELLYWVLLRLRDSYIKSVQKECVSMHITISGLSKNHKNLLQYGTKNLR